MSCFNIKIALVVLAVCFVGSVVGCSSSRPARFYMLTAVAREATDKDQNQQLNGKILGVGPVSIAKYLDRSNLVIRRSPNEVTLEEFHKWAGSPKDEIPTILVENLCTLLGVDGIYKYPWKSYIQPDYQIQITLLKLDGSVEGPIHLSARWEILNGKTRKRMKSDRADFTERCLETSATMQSCASNSTPASASKLSAEVLRPKQNAISKEGGLNGYVAAQSRALVKLSQLIAKSLLSAINSK